MNDGLWVTLGMLVFMLSTAGLLVGFFVSSLIG